jgi:6-pyruvoyltetrahydropterin/6-carboxytetrahydropterin synthase
MYEICVKRKFSAAHKLKKYKGMCRKLHGHNWEVLVYLQGEKLNSTGLLIDFKKIKAGVDKVLNELDHNELNKLKIFKKNNPSSENIAGYLFQKLSTLFNSSACKLVRVVVSEGEGTSAAYWK